MSDRTKKIWFWVLSSSLVIGVAFLLYGGYLLIKQDNEDRQAYEASYFEVSGDIQKKYKSIDGNKFNSDSYYVEINGAKYEVYSYMFDDLNVGMKISGSGYEGKIDKVEMEIIK